MEDRINSAVKPERRSLVSANGDHRQGRLSFSPLYQSALVSVRDYICQAPREGPGAEERADQNQIVLMRKGAFSKHFGRRKFTADLNQAAFFSKGTTYRVSHPADCGDRGTIFCLSPGVLNDVVREFDPSIDDHPERPFSFITSFYTAGIFWQHHEFIRRIAAAADPPEPLWADMAAIQIVAGLLKDAFGGRNLPRNKRRKGTQDDYIERAETAKSYLASHMSERVTLDAVANSVHMSPFHFARIFRQQSGVPLHRYLLLLRLRYAIQRLLDGEKDLARLAIELGFSSHSHFTDAFQRQFNRSPSQVRRDASSRSLREMSKNLKV